MTIYMVLYSMDSASPVGGRVGIQPVTAEDAFTPTGNFAGKSVTWRTNPVDAPLGNATTRLRPRYRDGDHHPAAGDGHRD